MNPRAIDGYKELGESQDHCSSWAILAISRCTRYAGRRVDAWTRRLVLEGYESMDPVLGDGCKAKKVSETLIQLGYAGHLTMYKMCLEDTSPRILCRSMEARSDECCMSIPLARQD